MRRSLAIARDYTHRRRVFGKLLNNQPLHLATLAEIDLNLRGCVFFTFESIALLGKCTRFSFILILSRLFNSLYRAVETGAGTPADDALLRLLTPLVKLYT